MSKQLLVVMLTVFSVAFAQAQTGDEIIAKHIEATGGKEKLNTITSVKMDNTMEIMGTNASSTSTILVGKGFRSESDFNGQKIIQVVTDKGGWAVNPLAGASDPQPISDELFKRSKYQMYFTPFMDYTTTGAKAEFAGKEKLGTTDALKVNFTTKDSISTSYFFDPTTYYILKTVSKADMMGQQVEVTTSYSDYKKSDFGVTIPYTMNIDFGQFQMGLKVNKVDFNQPVDPAIFEMKN